MAEIISRLRVNSEEYDAKIKRATQGLLAMEDACREVGGTLAVLEEDEKKFVQGLGQMETVSKSARGRLNELTQAYTELSIQYKRLTDEEKKGDFGKALSSSLEQLKTRIGEAKGQLKEVDVELGNTKKSGGEFSGVLDLLGGKLGMSTKALGVWGIALGAGTTALKVAKDAFFASEQNIDDWQRTVEASQSVYESFLQSLNGGDFSSFLSNINNIIQAANEAYNALDALQTLQILNSKKVGGQMTENERMRAMLRTGRYIAPLDGRSATMAEGTILTKAQKEAIAKQLENGVKSLISYQKEELGANTAAVNAKITEIARTLGTTADEFKRVTADDATLRQYREGYKKWLQFEQANTSAGYMLNGTYVKGTRNDAVNPYAQYGAYGWTTRFKEEGEAFQQIKTLRDQNQALQRDLISKQGQAYRAINTATNTTGGGGGGGKVGGGATWAPIDMQAFDFSIFGTGRSIADVQKNLASAQKQYNEAGDAIGRAAAQALIDKYTNELQMMKSEGNPFADAYSHDFQKDIERLSRELPATRGRVSSTEGLEDFNKNLSQMTGGISSIASGIEQLGVELPQGFKETISTMQGISTILTGIAAVVSIIQTMQGVQTATSLIPGLQNGGIVRAAEGWSGVVPGTRFSGDNIPILANAGEIVLNTAQTGRLASALQSGGATGTSGTPYVDGEKIFLGINNYLRRTGRGEIVTAR